MNQIEPIASKIPYMVAVGNHEFKEYVGSHNNIHIVQWLIVYNVNHNFSNFTHYRERFSMPGNKENLYYRYQNWAWSYAEFMIDFCMCVHVAGMLVQLISLPSTQSSISLSGTVWIWSVSSIDG